MISLNYPPLIGGPASNVPHLSSELAKKGFQIFVVTQGFPGSRFKTQENGFVVYRIPLPHLNKHHNPFVSILRAMVIGFVAGLLSLKKKVDVIHAHDMNISGIAGLVAKIVSGKRCVIKYSGDLVWEYISLIDWDPHRTLDQLWQSTTREAVILRTLERILFRAYDSIVAPSLYQEETLEKIGIDPNKIVVIPNAINYDLFSKALPLERDGKVLPSSKIVMTAGRLVPWKGLDCLIHAAKIVKQCEENVSFVVVGNGPDYCRLKRKVKELEVKSMFYFLGRKDYREIPRYLVSADIFVLPSVYEPAPHVVLEALACGKVVVTTDTGGLSEIIRSGVNGFLVKKGDYKELASIIIHVLRNKKAAERLTISGKNTAEKYDWKNIVSEFVEFYKSIK